MPPPIPETHMPSTSPVTVEQLQQHLDADAADNALLGQYNSAAVSWIEDYTVLLLSAGEVVQEFEVLAGQSHLRRWPVATITSVMYIDRAGASQELAPTSYRFTTVNRPATMVGVGALPFVPRSPGAVTVTYTAGFDTAAAVPATVVQAIYLLVGEFFKNREAGAISADASRALAGLLRPYRRRIL